MADDLEELSHPSFKIPNNQDVKIWRYMDLAKYLAILQRRSLFFPRATLLGDPFEGSSTTPMVAARQYIMKNRTTDPALAAYKDLPDSFFTMGEIFKSMVQNYLISCWHMNEHESAAMWSQYLQSNEGVCIRSTYRRLRSCLPKFVYIGEVNYIDYQTEGFAINIAFNFIMHKRKSFEHERELRAVFWDVHGSPDAQPYKMKVEPAGLWIEVELPSLIETVHISPTAKPWLATVIQEVTAKYDLHVPVLQSTLADSPLY
jgi:hypothetical protein